MLEEKTSVRSSVLPHIDFGGVAVDALDPPEDHVRAVAVGHGDHPLQGLGAEPVVGVEEEDVTPGRPWPRPTLRGPLGPPEFSWRITVTAMGARAANSSRHSPVPSRGAVVDGYDLDAAGRQGLRLDRGQALDQIRHRLVRPDDHRDIRLRNGHCFPLITHYGLPTQTALDIPIDDG